jgi:hypothetical protein
MPAGNSMAGTDIRLTDADDAITTHRCQQASHPQDRIWSAAHNQTPAA